MIEIAVVAMLGVLWMRPKWSILNKGGILLFLIIAPYGPLVWAFGPDRIRGFAIFWMIDLFIFLVIGFGLIAYRTRTDPALARISRQPAEPWFPIVARWVSRSFGFVWFFIILGVVSGTAWVLFGPGLQLNKVLTALLIAVLPLAPFVCVVIAVKAADLLTSTDSRREMR